MGTSQKGVGRRSREAVDGGWWGVHYVAPFFSGTPEIHRPHIIGFADCRGTILAEAAAPPDAAAAEARRCFEAAVAAAGAPPSTVRVTDEQLAGWLAPVVEDGAAVRVDPDPTAQLVAAELAERLAPAHALELTYLLGGRVRQEVVARLFEAAAALHQLGEEKESRVPPVLRLEAPEVGLTEVCLAHPPGEEGFLVFETVDTLMNAMRADLEAGPPYGEYEDDDAGDGEDDEDVEELEDGDSDDAPSLTLQYLPRAEVAPGMLRELDEHRWPLADAAAVPVVYCYERGMSRPALDADLERMIVCIDAVLAYSMRGPGVADAATPGLVDVEISLAGGRTVAARVVGPHPDVPWDALDDDDLDDLLDGGLDPATLGLEPPGDEPVYELLVELDQVTPRVWRRLLVGGGVTLAGLHLVLQEAMGWDNEHLHQFEIGRRVFGAIGEDAPSGMADESQVCLAEVLDGVERLAYLYDLGDRWRHTIRVERSRPAAAGDAPARCVEGGGGCPPEDCGGPLGYERWQQAAADPDDVEGAALLDAFGEVLPRFDLGAINANLGGLIEWAQEAD